MPEVGQNLGRYTLLKKLAVGGMGEIYLAARAGPLGFAPPVALKVLKDEFATDRQFVDMLVDEANICRFLNHQNVVSVLDFGESKKTYYIAMEYVQGLTLKQLLDGVRLRKKPLDLSVALYIATELCRALKYAHTRNNHAGEPLNIVHRDVTPGNVLLSVQGEVKLTDFGIARARGRSHQTQAGVLKGKFGYMAPEMLRYEAIDARADLFCTGVLTYEMVAGCHPVEGAAIMEAIQRFEERRIDPPSKFNPLVPKALDVILLRALEPKTSDRWASATALGNALQDLALQSPVLRGEMKNASQRLVELMRELEPSVFEQPVPKESLDHLLEVSRKAEDEARASLDAVTEESAPAPVEFKPSGPMRADSIPPRDDAPFTFRPTVGDHSSAMGAVSADSIPPTFIPSEKSSHAALKPLPKVKTSRVTFTEDEFATKLDPADLAPADSEGDEAATVAMPAVSRHDYAPDPAVRFTDTSTDRSNLRADLLDEPRLPGADETGPQSAVKKEDLDDRTIAMGMLIPDFDSVPDGRSPSSASGPIRVGNLEADTDEDRRFQEQELSSDPKDVPSSYLDDKTAYSPNFVGDDDAPTILPSSDLLQAADRTLLEPLDVHDALRQASVQVSDRDASADEEEPELPMAVRGREVSAGYLDDRTVAGVISAEAEDPRPAIEGLGADFNIPGAPTTVGVVSDDISVDQTLLGVISEPPPPARSARAAPEATRVLPDPDAVDAFSSAPRPNLSTKNGPHPSSSAPKGGMPTASGMPAPEAASSIHRPRVPLMPAAVPLTPRDPPTSASVPMSARTSAAAPSNLVPGAQTAQWMAGELPSTALSWSDDEAARRLVATRNAGAAAASPPRSSTGAVSGTRPYSMGASAPLVAPPLNSQNVIEPAMTSAYPRPQAPSAERAPPSGPSLAVIAALISMFVIVFGVVGIMFFTNAFWPRLAVVSEPPGAEVQVDGRVYGATPLRLKLKPNQPHSIELRLAGYPKHLVESLTLNFFGDESVSHRFERQERRLYIAPVAGTVFVNEQEAGTGIEVLLPADLDPESAVTIRVEANGYKPWQRKLPRLADIGKSLDVPLEAIEEGSAPSPPGGG